MPVDSKHPKYGLYAPQWQRCRVAFEGTDSVKGAGTEILPKLGGQSQSQYDAYLKRALWYGATERTINGLVGAIMIKEPDIKVPKKMEAYLEDITYSGVHINDFIKQALVEAFMTGRLGLLVDRADKGSRPWLAHYIAESIINWKDNNGDLEMVVLEETIYESDPADKFVLIKQVQYRELGNADGRYEVTIHKKAAVVNAANQGFTTDTKTPSNRGENLLQIPFVFINPYGTGIDIVKPPLLDMIDVNLSHFRTSADLEHGRHYLAVPTPWASGVSSDKGPLKLGAEEAWMLEDPQAQCGYLEFTGQGLSSLEKALEEKANMMAILGALLMAEGPKGVEAAETARIRKTGEISIAAGIAGAVAAGVEMALKIMAEWERCNPDEVSVKLNTEFVDVRLNAQDLKSLVEAWQSSAISLETLLWNIKEGGLLPPDRTVEDEMKLIELEQPTGLDVTEEDQDQDQDQNSDQGQ